MLKNLPKIIFLLKKQQKVSMLQSFRKLPKWQILISTILSARATDKQTIPICNFLFKKYSNLKKLAKANPKDIKKILRPIGYYNQKTKYILNTAKQLIKKYNGKVPSTMEELEKFPGVGKKVAACVMVYAHDLPEIPVDTHVAKISRRLGWTKLNNPEKIRLDLQKKIPKKYWIDINELLVTHGQTICFARKPKCYECSIVKYCRYNSFDFFWSI
jgi:endonuclease-3